MANRNNSPGLNPYRPAPGSEPPALVGRDNELSALSLSMKLTEARGAAQPIITTGLRGMGKTVLLRRAIRNAGPNAIVLSAEGSERGSLAPSFRRSLERATHELQSIPSRLRTTIDRVLARFPKTSFELPHQMGAIAIEGRDETDALKPFLDALYDLNEAAGNHGRFLVLAVDEIQSVPAAELVPIVEFIHATAGSNCPALLIGAGLPNSKSHLHSVKTYSERWRYFRLELLTDNDARDAIAIPATERNVAFAAEALELLVRESAGYPFFLQEYGSAAWATAHDGRISYEPVRAIVPGVRKLLDNSLYEPAFESLTVPELRYALALADLGAGSHRVSTVSAALGKRVESVNWVRNQLVKKDIIYAPATGLVEFRLPLTEQFLARNAPSLLRRFPENE
jgi:hypothetical protein